jgi:hypothetical protein
MAGISQYFHGEGGRVTALEWVADKEQLHYVMWLEGDPHRESANDYGSDIGIDPRIRPGDRVEYLRLSAYHGIWVRESDARPPFLDEAEARVMKNRERIEAYSDLTTEPDFEAGPWLDVLAEETSVPVRMSGPDGAPRESAPPRPAPPPTSIFLSYSRKNALPARRFFEVLLDAEDGSEVWLDLAQPGESLDHEGDISRWLKEAIDKTQVFVVLLTRDSISSGWVKREIEWAREKAEKEEGFHLVALKLDDSPTPASVRGTAHLVDGSGLSDGEFFEELYAAVYKRRGRLQWLGEQSRRDARPEEAGRNWAERWRSDYGVAKELRWTKKGNDIRWVLEYKRDKKLHRVEGGGERQVVDLGIRPGDRVGYFVFSHSTDPFTSVWMRSEDLRLLPNTVVRDYEKARRAPSPAVRAGRLLLILCGLLTAGLAAGLCVYLLRNYALVQEPPPEVDARFFGGVKTLLEVLVAASAIVGGTYQLVEVARAVQFEDRSGAAALKYLAAAWRAVLLGSLSLPFIYCFAALLYAIVFAIVFGILQAITGEDYAALYLCGFPVVYGVLVLYSLRRLWVLLRVRKPVRRESPKFSWF